MIFNEPETLSKGEKEILLLKVAFESITSMVNYAIFEKNHATTEATLMFKTSSDCQLFGILLLDYLTIKTFNDTKPHQKQLAYSRDERFCIALLKCKGTPSANVVVQMITSTAPD